MIVKKVLICMVALIIGQSCHKEPTPYYSGEQGLFFKAEANTFELPFGEKREFVKDSIVRIPIYLFGAKLKQAASFTLEADESSTAVAGRDYVLPSAFTFEADSIVHPLSVHLLRSDAIHDDTLTLVLRLIPNATFPATWPVGGGQAYTTTFIITTSDHIDEPPNWDRIARYYGPYSDKKLRLLISFSDPEYLLEKIIRELDFQADAKSYRLKKYLKEQQAAGTPVYEADGTLMEAGPEAPDNY